MQLNINIELGNAAHHDNLRFELEQNFSNILAKVDQDDDSGILFDTNGNKVGTWSIYEGEYE